MMTQEHTESEIQHYSVLMNEVVEYLTAHQPCHVLDCTFGGGGHTQALLEAIPGCKITALDTDPEALPRAAKLKEQYRDRFHFIPLNFSDLDQIELDGVDGVLMDLGVSHFQLKTPQRGLSFQSDGPLDMRLNPEMGESAYEFLTQQPREFIAEAIRDYGEEKQWRKITDAIWDARQSGQLKNSTRYLADLIASVARRGPKKSRIHPATQSFQGLRIAVNRELDALRIGLEKSFRILKQNGLLLVISFHSLEDRIVKQCFRHLCGMPIDRFDSRPQHMRHSKAKLLTKRPIEPAESELSENAASRSAKLRILEKTIGLSPNR